MGTLTIVTGMPGTRIRRSLSKFSQFAQASHGRSFSVFSIEEGLQAKAGPLVQQHFPVPATTVVQTFLLPRSELRRLWQDAWEEVLDGVKQALTHSDVLLTLHMAFFHQLTREYFVAADMPTILTTIRELTSERTRVVNFIDDIYDCHESLIAGGSASGMMDPPTSPDQAILDLLQVLDWRSIEIMLSESLASSLRVSHDIVAVKHPMQTFFDLLASQKRVIYLSHPISEPRRMEAAGREEEAREFVGKMAQILARLQADSTVIEPTTIDELRLKSGQGNLAARWPFGRDSRDLLYESPEDCPPGARPYLFPSGWDPDERDLIESSPLIDTLRSAIEQQIDARDHGLVEQARIIACYRPLYEGNASGGVQEELQHYGRLVSLGLRSAETSIVYSPDADRAQYPRRRVAESMIPAWRRQGILEGDDAGIEQLRSRLLREDSERVRGFLNGDADALLRMIAECGLTVRADDTIVPGGTLGAGEPVRRQAAGAILAEQVKRAAAPYLDELAEAGVIRLVQEEQMFYSALES